MKRTCTPNPMLALLLIASAGAAACRSAANLEPERTALLVEPPSPLARTEPPPPAAPEGQTGAEGAGGAPVAEPPAAPPLVAVASHLTIRPPSGAPLAPPPRALPVLPKIPALPPPLHQSSVSAFEKRGDMVDCGAVWTGTEYIPQECFDADARVGHALSARVVIPYEEMRAPPNALPRIVDHRIEGLEGPVRVQSGMPACTAMALTATLDHAYARWTGQPVAFSVMQVWARYHDSSSQLETVASHKRNEAVAADYNVGALLGREEDWPFEPHEARTMTVCPPDSKPDRPCGMLPPADKVATIEQRPLARVTQIQVIPSTRFDLLRQKLAAGQDVAVAIKVPSSYGIVGDAGSKYWAPTKETWDGKFKGSHQIALVGYAMTASGVFYLVHNSMGPNWGDQGFAWLSEEYLRAYSSDSLMVIPDVEPLDLERLRLYGSGRPRALCPAGEAPDSISAACVGLCPDGSPRHNDVCARPESKDCPAGMVNLIGACTLAAPKGKGTEPATGVQWSCGPGGCTYAIPKGKLGCNEAACGVSCPAPAFRLATVPGAIVCVE